MPVVPFTSAPGVRGAPAQPPADEPFILMAAAQMHSEGRLVEPKEAQTPSRDIESTMQIGDYAMPRVGKLKDYMTEEDKRRGVK